MPIPSSAQSRSGRPRSLRLRLLFVLVLAVLVCGFLEGASYGVFWILRRQPFTYGTLLAEQRDVREALRVQVQLADQKEKDETDKVPDPTKPAQVTPHPYVGYSVDASVSGGDVYTRMPQTAPTWRRSSDRFNVGLVGGSVAASLVAHSPGLLAEQLAALPVLKGKKIDVQVFALGGFKQPQQLMSIEYALSLGAEFDCVLNVDGYNEVVLGRVENLPFGTHPVYPRSWRLISESTADLQKQIAIGKAAVANQARLRWVEGFVDSWATSSVTLQLLWWARDGALHADADAALAELFELEKSRSANLRYALSGPPSTGLDDGNVKYFLADVWWRSSLQLHRVCEANGIAYLHFLQPNQYVPDSKPLSAIERRTAFLPADSPSRRASEEGYAVLATVSRRLVDAGVDFHDLTMIFAAIEEPIYVDLCCHVNQRGNEVMIQHIVAAVAQHLRPDSRATALVPEATEVVLEHGRGQLRVATQQQDGTVRPASGAWTGTTWTSSDSSVVVVDADGMALARSFGSATVVAKNGAVACSMVVHTGPLLEFGGVPGGPRLEAVGAPEPGNRAFALQFRRPAGAVTATGPRAGLIAMELGFHDPQQPVILHRATLFAAANLAGDIADASVLAAVRLPLPAEPALLGAFCRYNAALLPQLPGGLLEPTNGLSVQFD